jgi:hypothetical protein
VWWSEGDEKELSDENRDNTKYGVKIGKYKNME